MLAVRDRQDRAAFAALFDHYAPRVKGMLIRQNCSHGQADEIVQDVMLTVWRKAAQFDPERAQVSAWIYQIARNRHIDVIRKESRPMPEELAHEPDNEPDASQILGMEQEAARLKEALARLKPAQREMIEAAYAGDVNAMVRFNTDNTVSPRLKERDPRTYAEIFDKKLNHLADKEQLKLQNSAAISFVGGAVDFERITCPTLILSGADDRFVHPDNAQILADKIPGAQYHLIPETDHLFFLEKNQETAAHIRAFLEQL